MFYVDVLILRFTSRYCVVFYCLKLVTRVTLTHRTDRTPHTRYIHADYIIVCTIFIGLNYNFTIAILPRTCNYYQGNVLIFTIGLCFKLEIS